jgi:NHL repeat
LRITAPEIVRHRLRPAAVVTAAAAIATAGAPAASGVSGSDTITTFAGPGREGSVGDGGPARAAQLDPAGVAVDGKGSVYIADFSNNRVRKVNAGGEITTIAGTGMAGFSGDGGPATSAQLTDPAGVAVDRQGSVYIVDLSNNRVRKVSADGTITTFAGTGVPGFSGDGGPATAAQLNFPHGVAVDRLGNVYLADDSNNRVRKVIPTGRSRRSPGRAGAARPVTAGETPPAGIGALRRALTTKGS